MWASALKDTAISDARLALDRRIRKSNNPYPPNLPEFIGLIKSLQPDIMTIKAMEGIGYAWNGLGWVDTKELTEGEL